MPVEEATTPTSPNPGSEEPYGHSFTIYVYIITALAVLAAYALLLMISISYIRIAIIPVIMLGFISAVCFKLKGKLHGKRGDEPKNMVPWVALPFMIQLMQLLLKFVGQQNDNFVISHFLLFFSSSFGALTVMIAKVSVGSSLGVAKASKVFQVTFIVVLLMTVHTTAAEWVGEDMVLVCMPELIAALAWLTIHFDNGGYKIDIANVMSPKSFVLVLSVAVVFVSSLTEIFAYERKVLANYWYARVLCSCAISGVVSYISMWMIHHQRQLFGRSTDTVDVPIKLLEFSAYIGFCISAVLVAMRTGLDFFRSDQSVRIPVDPGLENSHTEAVEVIHSIATMLVFVATLFSLFLSTYVNVIVDMDIPREDQMRVWTRYLRGNWSELTVVIRFVASVISSLLIQSLVTK